MMPYPLYPVPNQQQQSTKSLLTNDSQFNHPDITIY